MINSPSKNVFAKPDFAYPQTVQKNALEEMKKAKALGDYPTMLLAAIQITAAQSEIATDSIQASIDMIDEMASSMPAPWNKMAYLIEAKVYEQIYQNERYAYDRRVLPDEPLPDNVHDWSGTQFQNKILTLLQKGGVSDYDTTPISSIQKLLSTSDYSKDAFPTVGSFLTQQWVDVLESFASGRTPLIFVRTAPTAPSERADEMIQQLWTAEEKAERAAGHDAASIYAMSQYAETLGSDERIDYLQQAYLQEKTSPWGAMLLLDLPVGYTKADEQKSHYAELKEALSAFPNGPFAPNLSNAIKALEQKSGEVKMRSQYLSTERPEFTVDLKNTNQAYVLVLKAPDGDGSVDLRSMLSKLTPVAVIPVKAEGEIPFEADGIKVSCDPLGYGRYVAVLSNSESVNGVPKTSVSSFEAPFVVSDMSVMRIHDNNDASLSRIAVLSGGNGAPLADADVTLSVRNKKTRHTLRTDKDGFVKVPAEEETFMVTAKKGKDILHTDYNNYLYSGRADKDEHLDATIFTNLPLYRPGDTVEFVGVVWSQKENVQKMAAHRKINAIMRDVNNQHVDTLRLTTSADGRLTGSFKVPTDGVLGNYSIWLEDEDEDVVGNVYFPISEYVAPTFFVEFDDADAQYTPGAPVHVKGRVLTFAGMPVADAMLKFDVAFRGFWYGSGQGAEYGGEARTDAEGRFDITLPTRSLVNSRSWWGVYALTLQATNGAGETQACVTYFRMGNGVSLRADIPEAIEVTGRDVRLNVSVLDAMERPLTRTVRYTVSSKAGGKTLTGEFTSPALVLDASALPSGEYEAKFECEDAKTSASFTIWRADDKDVPVTTGLWVPRTTVSAAPGETELKVAYGSCFRGDYIFYQVISDGKETEGGWVVADGRMHILKVKTPATDKRTYVKFATLHNLKSQTETVTLEPASASRRLTVETVSMRDNIFPGDKERWIFRIVDNQGHSTASLPVMAVMTDKALNEMVPFAWNLNPRAGLQYPFSYNISFLRLNTQTRHASLNSYASKRPFSVTEPVLNTYNMPLYSSYPTKGGHMLMRSMKMSADVCYAAAPAMFEMTEEAANDADVCLGKQADVGGGAPAAEPEAVQMSDMEHPLAFFMPNLTTDAAGNVEISFDAPAYSTTWQLQIAAYNDMLYSVVKHFDIKASKPVMVTPNVPRFLRTGDRVELRATAFNNTDATQAISGRIEVFDPATGQMLASQECDPADVKGQGSIVLTMDYLTPTDMSVIGLRFIARGGNHTDGVQTLVSVLPSSSPVFESVPFYIAPAQTKFTTVLPKLDKDASVTLRYCDNPVWYCVTALPDISTPDSESVMAKASALFGNAVASSLVKRYPKLQTALQYWSSALKEGTDSMLVSNLQKDASLKVLSLQNTVWVNNAASESERMQCLVDLIDADKADPACRKLLDDIIAKQTGQGGWRWFDGCEPSVFITSGVLLNLAMLKQMDCLPADARLKKVIEKAVKYCDNEIYQQYKSMQKPEIYPIQALSWLYIRSWYDVPVADSGIRSWQKKAIAKIIECWADFGIYDKATAAILMQRMGRKDVAAAILESLRQFAVTTPERGMYYDNIGSGWNGFGRLITTTQALEAFYLNDPHDACIDPLRQWLLLQRQAQDWGYDSHTSEVVWALLTTGSDWTGDAAPSVITVGDKTIRTEQAAYTGELTVQLDPAEASGKTLRIERSAASPAWGGILSQYIAPIDEVKAYRTDDISITKAVCAISADEHGANASADTLSVGQKVRVTLTIDCTRDLQYVVITDERGSFLEPADQLASYYVSDGVWMYREPRNTTTNLMIPFLPKGHHVISYECYVSQEGKFSQGIATIQSLYAPLITAHSAGEVTVVK